MNNIADLVSKVLPAIVPLLAALFGAARGPGAIRSRLKHDVELVEKLPDSAAREALLDLVEDDITALREYDTGSRHLSMLAVAVPLAVLLGYATIWLFTHGTWWSLVLAAITGFVTLASAYGIFESAERVPRDEKGRRIKPASRQEPSVGDD